MPSSFKWDDSRLRAEVNQKVRANMDKACLMVEADAKRFCPYLTGRLRTSITHEVEEAKDETIGVVGTNVLYGIFQEYGTSRMKAQPYLRPALNKNIPKIKQLFKGK